MTEKPMTLKILAEVPRGPRTKLVVALDRGPAGERYISIKWWLLGKQGDWIPRVGSALQLTELRAVAAALLASADELQVAP